MLWQLAVSDASGVVRFHSNRMSDTSSLLATQPNKADDAYLGTKVVLEVPSKTLDEFCAEQAIPSASILKLDVQGGEGLVLAGAKGLLARQAVDLILTEVWFDAPYVGAPHFCEIDAVLRAVGYQLYGMYFGPHQYENIPIFTADAIYLNAETAGQLDRECRAVSRGLAGEYTALFGE